MPYIPVDVTEITISSTKTWIDIDLGDYVTLPPGGVKGVAVRVVAAGGYLSGVRKKGWTTAPTMQRLVEGRFQHCMFVGVDANNLFQVYAESATYVKMYIIGYMTAGFEFLTQPVEYSIAASGSWTNMDFSANIPTTAIGVIVSIAPRYNYVFNLRNDGSTDNRRGAALDCYHQCWHGMVGCTNRTIEYYAGSTSDTYLYLLGYITDYALVTFNTNGTDYSTATTGSYTDLTALPVGAVAGLFECYTTAFYEWDIRKNDSTDEFYYHSMKGPVWIIVAGDGSRGIEGKIENAAVDYYLMAYFGAAAGNTGRSGPGFGDCMIL